MATEDLVALRSPKPPWGEGQQRGRSLRRAEDVCTQHGDMWEEGVIFHPNVLQNLDEPRVIIYIYIYIYMYIYI